MKNRFEYDRFDRFMEDYSGCLLTVIIALIVIAVLIGGWMWDYNSCDKKLKFAKTSSDSSYIIKESSCDWWVRRNK